MQGGALPLSERRARRGRCSGRNRGFFVLRRRSDRAPNVLAVRRSPFPLVGIFFGPVPRRLFRMQRRTACYFCQKPQAPPPGRPNRGLAQWPVRQRVPDAGETACPTMARPAARARGNPYHTRIAYRFAAKELHETGNRGGGGRRRAGGGRPVAACRVRRGAVREGAAGGRQDEPHHRRRVHLRRGAHHRDDARAVPRGVRAGRARPRRLHPPAEGRAAHGDILRPGRARACRTTCPT